MLELDIISIGECMVEFYSNMSFSSAETFNKSYGGDTLNVLVSAARLGSRTGFITRVGEDQFAPFLLQGWLNEKIDLSLVKVMPEMKNGVYFISTGDDDMIDYTEYRKGSAASTLCIEDLKDDYLTAGMYLHVSGISQAISEGCRTTILEACRRFKGNGSGKVAYDPYLRSGMWSAEWAQGAFQELSPHIDVLFLKHPLESELLTGISEPEGLIRSLWGRGISIVALKLGQNGCVVADKGTQSIEYIKPYLAGYTIAAIGAGDAFAGAFLHGLARGFSAVQAARLGTIMAGLRTQKKGTVASLPGHDDVYQLFEAA